MTTFQWLKYFLLGGVQVNTGNRNLAYIFHPGACVSSVLKVATQRLGSWKMEAYQFDCTEQAKSITAGAEDVFQRASAQGYAEMAHNLDLDEADNGEGLQLLVDWVDFGEDERTREPIENIWRDAADLLGKTYGKCA